MMQVHPKTLKKINPSKGDHFPIDSDWGREPFPSSLIEQQKPEVFFDENGYICSSSLEPLYRFHPEIVLLSPEIPQNTGSIARMCAGFSTTLHLIEPMAFTITEQAVRRAGLDYWSKVRVSIHKSWDDFYNTRSDRRFVFVETGGTVSPRKFVFKPGDILVFGCETKGISAEFMVACLKQNNFNLVTIPMFNQGVRSFNLSNTVSMVTYMCISQLHEV